MNLLAETIEDLEANKRAASEVKWVGSRDGKYAMTWDEFTKVANVDYDNGFGGQEIASDLVVVGDAWWLERHEYDGSEGWSFKTTPTLQDGYKPFSTVNNGDSWCNVGDMNKPGGKYGDAA